MAKLLTKSKYLRGLESDAYLWISVHKPDSLPDPDLQTQDIFDQGHEVGELAKELFENGLDLDNMDFWENINETEKAIAKEKTIFEAGIKVDRLYARVDVLKKLSEGWELIEVKGSTKAKPYHCIDLAFQKHVLEKIGLNVVKVSVVHINRDYVRKGDIEANKLLNKTVVTEQVIENQKGISERIQKMIDVIDLDDCPAFNPANIHKSEYGNPLIDDFMEKQPANSIFNLFYGNKKISDLYNQNIEYIEDIPQDYNLTYKQSIQRNVYTNEDQHVQPEKIKDFLNSLTYPLLYLDFETMMNAVPLFNNSRPYQQIPFQYSLHIESLTGDITHKEFLYDKDKDPRIEFIERLRRDLPEKGSIVVWNERFEKMILKDIASLYPMYIDFVNDVTNRIVDLWEPFRQYWYHHPKQAGSNSLKAVYPIFSINKYADLEISNGGDASVLYKKKFGSLSEKDKKEFLAYCELDTEAMIAIKDSLERAT